MYSVTFWSVHTHSLVFGCNVQVQVFGSLVSGMVRSVGRQVSMSSLWSQALWIEVSCQVWRVMSPNLGRKWSHQGVKSNIKSLRHQFPWISSQVKFFCNKVSTAKSSCQEFKSEAQWSVEGVRGYIVLILNITFHNTHCIPFLQYQGNMKLQGE